MEAVIFTKQQVLDRVVQFLADLPDQPLRGFYVDCGAETALPNYSPQPGDQNVVWTITIQLRDTSGLEGR